MSKEKEKSREGTEGNRKFEMDGFRLYIANNSRINSVFNNHSYLQFMYLKKSREIPLLFCFNYEKKRIFF